ncbi:MAG: MotA/TolQ/ExbB proton channel family protein [Planctomycetota bacterium]|nr:MotA/TolQ/ExbB proton channel family protein [Planctomycetota bacterium]MCX8039528.1 MotA/TolQ/ExbB proton channel family protein [Planctomycetota bacterium]MDW8373333.1 MotA/TolQ/ExbB proton channel family protein [Planctomycetota bacterium]
MIAELAAWWSGGIVMPLLFVVGCLLYSVLIERTLALARRRAPPADEAAPASPPSSLSERLALARGLALARALAAVLPLLGLYGTVSGMVDTFAALAASSAPPVQGASRGVGLALASTQYALALAVPAWLWLWALERHVRILQNASDQRAPTARALPP